MCGFVGGMLRRPATESDAETFRRAVRVLGHRGPDDEGVEVIPEGPGVLAFRRLSILDHAGGAQPMSTGRGQHLVFNGEIYNYRELRQRLKAKGVALRTRSDTEALLLTLTLQGRAGLDDVVGMFGFAFVDVPGRVLWLARDRLGVKQVYYADTPEGFFFASEPKALLELPWTRPELATDRLAAYFTFRAAPAPATLFRGIRKLGPGEALRLDLDSREWTVERYWTLPDPRGAGREDSSETKGSLDRFEQAFLDSVERRLIADVPVGAFLSGGLDSSLVVAAMRRLGHPDIATFSAVFPGSPDDEAPFARRVSERFGTRHFEHPSSPSEFLGTLDRWVELNDDLVADASCLPLLSVSRLARRNGYIVLLSGEGADELFGGYGSYGKYRALHRLNRLLGTRGRRTAFLSGLERTGVLSAQDRPRAVEYLVRGGGYMGTAALLGSEELERFLSGPATPVQEQPRAQGNRMEDLSAFDFRTRIPEDLMVRTDRATMGASIEARVPFLDPDVVRTAFALPPWQRSLPGVSKVVLRRLARRWGVPNRTLFHRKIGFQVPLGPWFRNELSGLWSRILDERAVPGLAYDQIAIVYDAHRREEGEYEEILWRVAALELWYRRWILGERADRPAAEQNATSAAGRAQELV